MAADEQQRGQGDAVAGSIHDNDERDVEENVWAIGANARLTAVPV